MQNLWKPLVGLEAASVLSGMLDLKKRAEREAELAMS